MSYDPFARGSFPVGVATVELKDAARENRSVVTEVWYPAVDNHKGEDLVGEKLDRYELLPGFPPNEQQAVRSAVPRLGGFPAVVFSHGYGGHRRQSTYLCTHLASHGFVVLAPDHLGNTIGDLVRVVLGKQQIDPAEYFRDVVTHRPADMAFLIDALTAGKPEPYAQNVQRERVGVAGHSFGGWTALAATSRVDRVAVLFTLASAGGPDPRAGERLLKELDFEWDRVVPSLFVAAEGDSVVALDSVRDLFARVRAPKKLVVLENSDHYHFCDNSERVHDWFRAIGKNRFLAMVKQPPPFAELCAEAHGHDLSNALALAQFEAFLKDRAPAKDFLAADLVGTLAARGIGVTLQS